MEKTLKFIEKSRLIHGYKYDYSLVYYKRSNEKVKIICPIHGEFEQRASGHLAGNGCSKCSHDNQKLTKDIFIDKSRLIHGDKYDYSQSKYNTYDDNVKIICPVHGEFEQSPNNHLKGSECLKCSFIKRKRNINKFILNANIKHNNKYDYSFSDYKGFNKKIKIFCQKHGVFEQTPQNHLKGNGCPICSESKGENNIRQLLSDNKIKFIHQQKFNNCRDKYPLPFDFYLPDYNICIEFNGIQHYKPIKYWGGEKGLIEQQKRDNIKVGYCLDNKIKLITIKYNENIDKILIQIKKQD